MAQRLRAGPGAELDLGDEIWLHPDDAFFAAGCALEGRGFAPECIEALFERGCRGASEAGADAARRLQRPALVIGDDDVRDIAGAGKADVEVGDREQAGVALRIGRREVAPVAAFAQLEPFLDGKVAVVTGDVPMGCSPETALDGIRLLMLANDVSLRNLIPAELAKGFGFFQSKPATAFSPVSCTPDELGAAWQGGRVHLNLESVWNGKRVGLCSAGEEMTFHFGQLIAHIGKTRNVRAGSIVGSGTVSNKDWSRGYSCIAEKRAIETIESGAPKTEFMRYGDTIRIEMKGADGQSLFGAIEQKVAPLQRS